VTMKAGLEQIATTRSVRSASVRSRTSPMPTVWLWKGGQPPPPPAQEGTPTPAPAQPAAAHAGQLQAGLLVCLVQQLRPDNLVYLLVAIRGPEQRTILPRRLHGARSVVVRRGPQAGLYSRRGNLRPPGTPRPAKKSGRRRQVRQGPGAGTPSKDHWEGDALQGDYARSGPVMEERSIKSSRVEST